MKKEVDQFSNTDLKQAVDCLKKGGIILYPTDTVWGIGCDATNSEAVKKIFRLKHRQDAKSMLVIVANEAAMERLVDEVPEVAWELIEAAVDPLTLILDDGKNVCPEIIAEDGSIGIRITREKFSNELCKRLGRPLVSTSANLSGEKSPANFDEIDTKIKEGVDYMVEYRRDDIENKKPSNIIKLGKTGEVKIIR